MDQLIQLCGALLVLLGYALGQLGKLDTRSKSFLTLNLIGSALLALDAWGSRQWGFLILNGTWGIVSLVNLFRTVTSRAPTGGNV